MKIGRILGSIFAVLLFCIGMGVYSIHVAMKNIVSDQLIGSAIDEMLSTAIASGSDILLSGLPEDIKKQVPQEILDQLPEEIENEITSLLPAETQKELESVKEEIANDPQVLALSQKYMEAIIAGSTNENAVLPDVNKDIEEIIEVNFPKIASAVGTDITKEQVSALAKEVANDIDAQGLFNKGMETIRSSITPQQQQLLSTVSFVQSSTFMMIGIGCMAVAMILVALLKKSLYKWMPMIGTTSLLGGILILLGGTLGNMLVGARLEGLGSTIAAAGGGVIGTLFQCGMNFMIAGAVILVVYLIIKFISNRVVYE